jgi:hypothetical protein
MTIAQTLKDYDEQISKRRQRIAVLQVEIVQIEDARRTALWLAEEKEREAALAAAGLQMPHDKPLLIVREKRPDPESGVASRIAKYGSAGQPAKKPRKKRGPNTGSEMSEWRQKIVSYLSDNDGEPASSADIANYHGLPTGEEHRKPLQNAIYNMVKAGQIERAPGSKTGPGVKTTYVLPTTQQHPNGGAH